jgi:hypothetical protein
LKKKSLSGDKIQRELEKLESQRRGVNTQLIDAQPKLHKLNREIDELTKVFDKDQTLLDASVRYDFTRSRHLVIVADVSQDDYAKIVPGLSGNLRELTVNIDLARRDYEQVLERYQDSSSQLQKAFLKMKSSGAQQEEDMNVSALLQEIAYLLNHFRCYATTSYGSVSSISSWPLHQPGVAPCPRSYTTKHSVISLLLAQVRTALA